MKKLTIKKFFAIVAIALLFLNLVFVGLGVYSHLIFWIIIAVIAICSTAVMKLIKEK